MGIAITILAGGRSLRFGQDKRFFNLYGKSLINIAIEKAKSLNLRTYLSVDNDFLTSAKSYPAYSIVDLYDLIVDDCPCNGPLGGIASTLKKIEEEKSLFIPVDMPFLPVEFLLFMKEKAQYYEIMYSTIFGNAYPLPSLVPKIALKKIGNLLESHELALNRVFKIISQSYKTYFIDEETISEFGDPNFIFHNINYMEDLEYHGREYENRMRRGLVFRGA